THLRSRTEVAERLQSGPVPVTILRAAIIIGSGSASYEMLDNLVARLPVIFTPREVRSLCQPIAIRDVVKYLVGSLEAKETTGGSFDIGGDDVMSYREMMRTVARVLDRRRPFITMPLVSLKVFGYVAGLLTPVPGPITMSLMEGLKNDVICEDSWIRRIIPFNPLPYTTALVRAMSREEQDRVHTRWSDAYPPASELAIRLVEVHDRPMYCASSSIETYKEANGLFDSICSIGGREGWFHGNWLWRIRGAFDRIIMGVGTRRGRKSASGLAAGDVVDFWRVEDIIPSKRLLLRAEMKLPGKAWLEFHIGDHGECRKLSLTARYMTATLFGRAYWYFFLPFHRFIFKGLLRQIEERSG
ncbi:MAG: SDR family oxidoreductase, partial [Candidatus Krumholzibacteria bacterium]|nr:SDR family oxidoreductase [Candidatus Krumholzibacteria bacterium]